MVFLIVDDDTDVLNIITKLLELKNHQVIAAENALEAIDRITENNVDIVITDATMPEFSGFDLIRSLKNNEKYAHLTLAMLTGRREKEDIQHALDLGVQDYIVKPIEPDVLLTKIENLVEKHQKRLDGAPKKSQIMVNMKHEIPLERVTDVGVTVTTSFPLAPGNIVNVDIEELTKHMIFKNRFRVIFSKAVSEKEFQTELLLLDLNFSEKEILENLSDRWEKKKMVA